MTITTTTTTRTAHTPSAILSAVFAAMCRTLCDDALADVLDCLVGLHAVGNCTEEQWQAACAEAARRVSRRRRRQSTSDSDDSDDGGSSRTGGERIRHDGDRHTPYFFALPGVHSVEELRIILGAHGRCPACGANSTEGNRICTWVSQRPDLPPSIWCRCGQALPWGRVPLVANDAPSAPHAASDPTGNTAGARRGNPGVWRARHAGVARTVTAVPVEDTATRPSTADGRHIAASASDPTGATGDHQSPSIHGRRRRRRRSRSGPGEASGSGQHTRAGESADGGAQRPSSASLPVRPPSPLGSQDAMPPQTATTGAPHVPHVPHVPHGQSRGRRDRGDGRGRHGLGPGHDPVSGGAGGGGSIGQ